MGQIVLNQPLPCTGKQPRLAFVLATLIGLQAISMATSWAESGSDLVISKDGGNVNVNLNTATSSDVSIRRSDDIMVIHVPKSYKGGLSIDPSLKKNSLVQETETPTGKAITIQSQQIYLHTFEGEPGSGPQLPAVSSKSTESKSERKTAESANKADVDNAKSSATTGSVSGEGKHLSVKPKKREEQATSGKENGPPNLTRLLNQESLLSVPLMGDDDATPEGSEAASAKSVTPVHAKTTPKAEQSGKPGNHVQGNKPAGLPATASVSAKLDDHSQPEAEALPISGDPESEPLEVDSKRQAAAMQASIGGLLRIFFSLGIVLALAVAFMKILLPKLMDRYPDFFDRLREGRQWVGERGNDPFFAWPRPVSVPVATQAPLAADASSLNRTITSTVGISSSTAETSRVTPAKAQPLIPRADSGKKNYLERLQVGGDYFQVLQTTELGKGKELHLVELKGKQFLVATTPYTVTLLKDFSDDSSNTPLPFPMGTAGSMGSVFPEVPHRLGTPGNAAPSRATEPARPAQPSQTSPQREAAPVQSETIAYLSDATPIRRVTAEKPYATPPGQAQRANGKSQIPQFPARPQPIYQPVQPKFYADTSDTPSVPGMGASTRRPAPSAASSVSASGHAYVDAEEVLVLEDYDDLYR